MGDLQRGTVSSGFQLSGYYGNYHWSPVCFESKQIYFGVITGLEDVTGENDGDHSSLGGNMSHLSLFNSFINTWVAFLIGMVEVKMGGHCLEPQNQGLEPLE